MKKTLAGLALALTLSMTGCVTVESGESSTAPSAPTSMSPDERYLSNMEDEMPEMMGPGVNEDKLIEAGHEVCAYFDEFGVSPNSFMAFMDGFMEGGQFSDEETATIITISMDAYCPETLEEVLDLGESAV